MDTVTRIVALALLLVTSVSGAPEPPRSDPPAAAVTVVGASMEQQETLDHALNLFDQAGLDLPPLIIEYADDTKACGGHAGLFRSAGRNPATITICHRLPLFLFHELGHAWEDHVLTDRVRQRFLDHWALEVWNDDSVDWYHRGAEKAAHTIAYTLTLSQPTENSDILQFVCSYELLTGNPIPEPELASCPVGTNNAYTLGRQSTKRRRLLPTGPRR